MDETIFRYFNNFAGRSDFFDSVIVFSAETLGVVLLTGLVIFLFSHEHKRQGFHNVIIVLSVAFLAWGLSQVINILYPSPRPFFILDDVNKLMNHGDIDSFPSGHATFFSSIATALYFYHKKIAVFYWLGALVIGVSRIAVGIHWPADILVGYLIGGVIAVLFYHTYSRIFR